MRSPRSRMWSISARASVDLPDPDRPVKKKTAPCSSRGGRSRADDRGHVGGQAASRRASLGSRSGSDSLAKARRHAGEQPVVRRPRRRGRPLRRPRRAPGLCEVARRRLGGPDQRRGGHALGIPSPTQASRSTRLVPLPGRIVDVREVSTVERPSDRPRRAVSSAGCVRVQRRRVTDRVGGTARSALRARRATGPTRPTRPSGSGPGALTRSRASGAPSGSIEVETARRDRLLGGVRSTTRVMRAAFAGLAGVDEPGQRRREAAVEQQVQVVQLARGRGPLRSGVLAAGESVKAGADGEAAASGEAGVAESSGTG